jgi:WD40 repeat protein
MARVPCLKLTVVAVAVGVMIGLSPAGIEAQSVGERIKRAAEAAAKALEAKNKAKEEQRQKGEQPGPPETPTRSQGRGRQPNDTPAAATQKPSSAKVEAEVVAPVAALERMFISPRGAHLATAVQRGSRWVVTHDGVDGPRFDEIATNRVRFSPDGSRYLYVARSGEEYVVMVDGKELARMPRAGTNIIRAEDYAPDFSPNSKHVSFAVERRGSANEENYCQLYVNGQPVQKSYGGSEQCKPTWSPDGSRYAMIINPVHTPGPSGSGSPHQLIVDGKPAGYPGPGFVMSHPDLKFTADGKHLFVKTVQHTPGRDPTHVMFMDGKPWVKAQNITVHVPPAGDRVVAVISSGQGGTSSYHQFLHVDGKKVPGSECPGYGLVVRFSPDGKRYAAQCQIQGAKGHSLVVDGKKGQEYDYIEHFGFTPDSSKVVYVARMGRQVFVVTGEEESDGYQRVVGPDPAALPVAFGAGGKRIGYAVQTMNSQCGVVVDGKLTLVPPPSCVTEVSFSSDGSRYASFGGATLIVDGAVQNRGAPAFNNRTTSGIGVVFSPDGKYIAHLAGIPSDASRVALVVNDRQMLLPSSTQRAQVFMPTFTPDGRHFVFAGVAGGGFPLGQELIVYVDGRPAARFPGGAPGFPWLANHSPLSAENGPAWEIGPAGVLTFLVKDGVDANAVMKRVKITLPTDTNIDTMLSEMRPVGGR